MRLDLSADEVSAVECAIEETIERCEAHLVWLDGPVGEKEDNRDVQIASTVQRIEVLLAVLSDVPPTDVDD